MIKRLEENRKMKEKSEGLSMPIMCEEEYYSPTTFDAPKKGYKYTLKQGLTVYSEAYVKYLESLVDSKDLVGWR